MIRSCKKLVLTVFALALSIFISGCSDMFGAAKSVVKDGSESFGIESIEELEGDWYGWWRVYDCSGDWKDAEGYWWDCCMEISSEGRAVVWDEDMSKEKYLADAKLKVKDGRIKCTDGSFLEKSLNSESWDIGFDEDECGELITISGKYKKTDKSGFSYEMRLRPWGDKWPGDEEKPYYYEDWYMQMIEDGKKMPDTIGPEDKK